MRETFILKDKTLVFVLLWLMFSFTLFVNIDCVNQFKEFMRSKTFKITFSTDKNPSILVIVILLLLMNEVPGVKKNKFVDVW